MNSNGVLVKLTGVFLTLLVLAGGVRAQEEASGPLGFLRLVNGVNHGTGDLVMKVDGVSVRDEGYKLGSRTGGIPVSPGMRRVRFECEGVEPGETTVHVKKSDTTILVPFSELVPATDEKPAHWTIRVLRLKQYSAEKERVATFVSVSRHPELKLEVRQGKDKWETVHVKRLSFARVNLEQPRGYVQVRCGDVKLKDIVLAGYSNHVSVLYDDDDGVLRSKPFIDYKYVSPE